MYTIKSARLAGILLLAAGWPGPATAAEDAAEAESALSGGEVLEQAESNTHGAIQADPELLKTIRNDPGMFIGKKLEFTSGEPIGPITDVRRHAENLELYFIVDATEFFNSATMYAVEAKDVESYTEDAVLMPMAEGMHLRGRMYYPEDYTEVDDYLAEPATP